MSIGKYLRELRENLYQNDKKYSLRQVAFRLGVEPSYLSKIERDLEKSISENLVLKIADEFQQDKDVLLAMAGKVSLNLQNIILKNPKLFSELLNSLKDSPDHAILRIVREVKDGNW